MSAINLFYIIYYIKYLKNVKKKWLSNIELLNHLHGKMCHQLALASNATLTGTAATATATTATAATAATAGTCLF